MSESEGPREDGKVFRSYTYTGPDDVDRFFNRRFSGLCADDDASLYRSYAERKLDEDDYELVLYCLLNDPDLPEGFYERFRDNRELNLMAKIRHGDRFASKVEGYDGMSREQLMAELQKVRSSEASLCIDAALRPDGDTVRRSADDPDIRGTCYSDFFSRPVTEDPVGSYLNELCGEFSRRDETACVRNGSMELSGFYPERCLSLVLQSMGIDYERGKRFPWSGPDSGIGAPVLYDFYLPRINTIIEVRDGRLMHGPDDVDVRGFDRFKQSLASDNGICRYITVTVPGPDIRSFRSALEAAPGFTSLFGIPDLDWDRIDSDARGLSVSMDDLPLANFRKMMESIWYEGLWSAANPNGCSACDLPAVNEAPPVKVPLPSPATASQHACPAPSLSSGPSDRPVRRITVKRKLKYIAVLGAVVIVLCLII